MGQACAHLPTAHTFPPSLYNEIYLISPSIREKQNFLPMKQNKNSKLPCKCNHFFISFESGPNSTYLVSISKLLYVTIIN